MLSFRGHLTPKWSQIGAQNRPVIQRVVGSFLDHLLDHFWVLFGAIFGTVLERVWDPVSIWEAILERFLWILGGFWMDFRRILGGFLEGFELTIND